MDLVIRPARLADGDALHRNCFPHQSAQDVHDYLAWCLRQADKGWIARMVAEVGGEAVGNVQLTLWGDEGEVGSLIVAGQYRRHGVARQLLSAVIAKARRRALAVLWIDVAANRPEIAAFYRHVGFTKERGLSPRSSRQPWVRLCMVP
jgi:ribosomal protein S18 acetylase RimI-like enzyme